MTRKRRQSAELPLFDLPLQPEARDPELAVEDTGTPLAVAQGPSVLDDGDENAGEGVAQLELIEPVAGAAPAGAEPEAAASGATAPDATAPEDAALLGDRLLGGLADLAVQLLMLGLAIAASHALGVAVSPADWMPFAVLALAFSFLYWVVPLAFWGQTPGMAWVGHTAREADGEPLTFSQTFRRWLGAFLTLALAGLPLLLALTGRSFTDRLSGSRTVAE